MPIITITRIQLATLALAIPLSFLVVVPFSNAHIWSPYYKIYFQPLQEFYDYGKGEVVTMEKPFGYSLAVNNDYHQMLINLSDSNDPSENSFFRDWRALYNAPYKLDKELPAGPILIVGAGTGNDIAAALRSTNRDVVAVEIDPVIRKLGLENHFEKPYSNPRVKVVINDARSYFQNTDQKFALVVFGFLDSHTLLSSFSSLRLDNFVYTEDSFRKVKDLLVPGGQISVTFTAPVQWLAERIKALVDQSFDAETEKFSPNNGYANGSVYRNFKAPLPASAKPKTGQPADTLVPDDDWPFLYLRSPYIPQHYVWFIALVVICSVLSFFTLPAGKRQLKLPYFFMGAAFFLLETSNVVSLSLLYGSTWVVNLTVFTGILALVLIGNLVAEKSLKIPLTAVFVGLFASVLLAYFVQPSRLLSIEEIYLRSILAIVDFLGPVFFSSIIFARLIRDESEFYSAYGSNLLGAVIGGVSEYASISFGFKFLLVITLALYLLTYLFTAKNQIGKKSGASTPT